MIERDGERMEKERVIDIGREMGVEKVFCEILYLLPRNYTCMTGLILL